eukprot:596787-Amphidinium_carterae.2
MPNDPHLRSTSREFPDEEVHATCGMLTQAASVCATRIRIPTMVLIVGRWLVLQQDANLKR